MAAALTVGVRLGFVEKLVDRPLALDSCVNKTLPLPLSPRCLILVELFSFFDTEVYRPRLLLAAWLVFDLISMPRSFELVDEPNLPVVCLWLP